MVEVLDKPGSHQIAIDDDSVTIFGLELFVGFDPSIDSEDDERISEYDADRINEIVQVTSEYMRRGQNPKLILGHNKAGDTEVRPAIGDIIEIRSVDIHGAPGIVGDVQMSRMDFESYIKSNRYPRRSAEIWREGFMSEVAVLGSETPARPLRDTKFGRADVRTVGEDRVMFARDYQEFAMADDPKKMAELEKERDELAAKLKAAEEEIEKMKAQADEAGKEKEKAEKEADKHARALQAESDKFSALMNRVNELEVQRINDRLDADRAMGYVIADDRRDDYVSRIVAADDSDAEYEFLKSHWKRVPNDTIDHNNIQSPKAPEDAKKSADKFQKIMRQVTKEQDAAQRRGEAFSASARFEELVAEGSES